MTAFDDLDRDAVNVRAAFDKATSDNLQLLADNTAKQDQIHRLEAEVARLQDIIDTTLPPVDPPPVPVPTGTTIYGACPIAGKDAASVVTKFGKRTAIRWFDGAAGFSKVPTRPADCRLMHASWKLLGKNPPTTPAGWDAAVEKVCVNLLPGDIAELEHEHDVKWHKEAASTRDATLATRLKLKGDFNAAVKRVRPDLRTACTIAVGRFDGSENLDRFFVEADYVGIDFDGIQGVPDFTKSYVPNILKSAFVKRFDRVTIPELAFDAAAARLAALQRQVPVIVSALKPVAAMYWDDGAAVLNTAAEIDYWKSLIAA